MASTRSAASGNSRLFRRITMIVAVFAVASVALWFVRGRSGKAPEGGYRTATVDRGDIRVGISATGTLAATSTVDIGSQISGQVTQVLVDFNDHVRRGQVLARLDPSTFEAQIAQGAAQVQSARANLASAEAALRNAQADYARKSQLADEKLVSRSDADLARAARDQATAQVNAARAQIVQQQESTRTSRVNLDRSVIRSPVDGVVLTRSIEPGQTVAASLQAPVMFQIAEDLSQMQIVLAIDEADIGQVKMGQGVSFSVDAFPERQFRGRVEQVRLSPTNTANVITYPVVVAVDNSDQTLLPGMTANAEIEVSRRDNVLRVPNAALRFKPADEGTDASAGRAGGGDRAGMSEELPRIASELKLDPAQQAAFDAALAQMRERAAARRKAAQASGGSSGAGLFGRGPGGPPGGGQNGGNAGNAGAMRQRMQERFREQFAAFRATLRADQQAQWDRELASLAAARRAPVYVLKDGKPEAVYVRIGASDGSFTEVSGGLGAGDTVIVGTQRAAP